MKYVVVNETERGTRDCGHKHRTEETARRCQSTLIGLHRTRLGGQECSAEWYNSHIIECDITAAEQSDRIAASIRDLSGDA